MSGNRNTGYLNTGNLNTGNLNTGYLNTGNLNTGNRNTGYLNTGSRNTGNRNTGNLNTGNLNTGNWNTGNLNTGNLNTGNLNTGNLNTGNLNTGYFCVEDGPVYFFDVLVDNITHSQACDLIPFVNLPISCEWVATTDMTEQEKNDNPSYAITGGFLREIEIPIQQAFPLAWGKMDQETKDRFLSLPNFDAEKFLKCTGVDVLKESHVQLDKDKMPDKTIVLDGVTYRLVPLEARP